MKSGAFWKWFPVLLLGPTMIFAAWRVFLVVNDPAFAADETAYERGLVFDQELARRAASAELGWTVAIETPRADAAADGAVRVRVHDRSGQPVAGLSGSLRAFHNAHPADARDGSLLPAAEPGVYTARVRADLPGLWQWQVSLAGDAGAWSGVLRAEVARP